MVRIEVHSLLLRLSFDTRIAASSANTGISSCKGTLSRLNMALSSPSPWSEPSCLQKKMCCLVMLHACVLPKERSGTKRNEVKHAGVVLYLACDMCRHRWNILENYMVSPKSGYKYTRNPSLGLSERFCQNLGFPSCQL